MAQQQQESTSSETHIKVKQFMSILEQLPRLCSPTICGTLSQPTTRAERISRGADIFEWSLEQKAILSPANITADIDATGDWQNLADLNPSWRQQESETFFSQRTIAPSPMITPSTTKNRTNGRNRPRAMHLVYDEDEEDDEVMKGGKNMETNNNTNFDNNYFHRLTMAEDLSMTTTNSSNRMIYDQKSITTINQTSKLISYEFEEEDDEDIDEDVVVGIEDEEDDDDDNDDDDDDIDNQEFDDNQEMDDLLFSPQPLKSSQTQQKMDFFSPESFVRVMEDENTLQSTPKTIGSSSQRARQRNRNDMFD